MHARPLSALGGGGFSPQNAPSAKLRNKVQIKHIRSATCSLGAAPLPNHDKKAKRSRWTLETIPLEFKTL
jgi:hypothetical protein